MCLDQMSFKCKIDENWQNSNFKFPSILMELFFIAILLGVCLSCLESNDLPSIPRSNIRTRHEKNVAV